MAQENQVVSQPSAYHYIHSAAKSHTGGHSRITIPVELPKNTIAWYYRFKAWREEGEVAQVKQQMNLFADLVKFIPTVGAISSLAINSTAPSQTPDICDIYLLDKDSYHSFVNKIDIGMFDADKSFLRRYPHAVREGLSSGTITITEPKLLQGTFYLGIRNPDLVNGIHVTVEIVAVVSNPEGGSSTVVSSKSTVNTDIAQVKKVSQMDQAEEALDKDAKKMGVFSYAPILENPDIVNSRQIGQARNNYVVILRQVSDKYYYVRNGRVEGYLFVAFLNP